MKKRKGKTEGKKRKYAQLGGHTNKHPEESRGIRKHLESVRRRPDADRSIELHTLFSVQCINQVKSSQVAFN